MLAVRFGRANDSKVPRVSVIAAKEVQGAFAATVCGALDKPQAEQNRAQVDVGLRVTDDAGEVMDAGLDAVRVAESA